MPIRFLPRRKRKRKDAPLAWERKQTTKTHTAIVAGRRHLTHIPYALPKDTGEIHRLDFQHYLLRQVLYGNYLAPIQNPTAILDVGAGTGIWGHELARQFPYAQVYGVDLENIKTTGSIPANYHFVQGNALERLPFDDETFDFVHQRLLVAAIPAASWPGVIAELLRVTKQKGYLELVECGVEISPLGPLTKQFLTWGLDISALRGLDARIIPFLDRQLAEVGAQNIQSKTVDIPIGAWGGRIGDMMAKDLLSAFGGLKALYISRGATEDDFEQLVSQLPAEWQQYHSSIRFFIFDAQK